MKILLTGSTGFIGSFYKQYSRYKDFIIPFSFQNDSIIKHDFSKFDIVVHLAALVHEMNDADPKAYQEVNATKTLELAQKAKSNGVKQFVFMSTVKVYGEGSDSAYTETSPCNPADDYGKSKFFAEQELLKLQNDQFIISIIRTPIVYGVDAKANIKNLITLIQRVPILPLRGIHNQRSMVYIGNLAHLIDTVIKQQASGIFLAADDSPISTTDLVQKIAEALGRKQYLFTLPFFASSLRQLKPSLYQRLFGNFLIDNTLTKQQLNFQNPYSTEKGIKLMIQGTP